MAKNEVAVIEKKIIPLVEKAKKHEIKSEADMTEAVQMLSEMNKIGDNIKAEKEKITAPAKLIVKTENARWKPLEEQYEEGIAIIRSAMSVYQTEQDRIATKKAADIAARVGEGRGKIKAETAIAKIDELDKPAQTISTTAGSVKFRTDKKLKIIDESKIPRAYLLPDSTRILADLKEGKKIAGCEIEEIKVPVNSR